MKWSDPAAFELTAYEPPGFKERKLDKYAAMASRLHPRVNDWICAAPILAVALNDQRYYQGLYDLACARGKVVDALRLCHIPTPMRKQRATEADLWHKLQGWRAPFPEMPESELAQTLAKITGERERGDWVNKVALAMKKRPTGTDFSEYARWAVRMSAAHDRNTISMITDYIYKNTFEPSWTVGQYTRAHHDWVERMRVAWHLQREARNADYTAREAVRRAKFDKMLDEPVVFAPFPLEWQNSLGKAAALNTARKLLDEGSRMRHCVGGEQFRSAMRKGRALYFHIEAGQERSTLEIQKSGDRYAIGQHCGPCNARPSPALQAIASAMLGAVLKAALPSEEDAHG